MKYIVAVLACVGESFLYSMFCVMVGWKYGGGVIPQILLWTIFAATWRGIMKHYAEKEAAQSRTYSSSAEDMNDSE